MNTRTFATSTCQIEIDLYLDAVDRMLLSVSAPRNDRLHIIRELETQIYDMLSAYSEPIALENVAKLISSLEPPARFAEQYRANATDGTEQPSDAARSMTKFWTAMSAGACFCLVFSLIGFGICWRTSPDGLPLIGLALLTLATLTSIVTPLFSFLAYSSIRQSSDYEWSFVLWVATSVYILLVSLVLTSILNVWTQGYVLWCLGLLGLGYAQYRGVLWLRKSVPQQAYASSSGFVSPVSAPRESVNNAFANSSNFLPSSIDRIVCACFCESNHC